MLIVIIESPFGSRIDGTRASSEEVERNVRYARAAMRACLLAGEAPYASHLLYPQVLDDATPEQREMGLHAGWQFMAAADYVAVYEDLGITPGMQLGIERAKKLGLTVVPRKLDGWDGAR
jgi:hypothetical protein